MYRGISITFILALVLPAGALSLTGCTEASLTALNAAAQLGDYRRTANIPYGALPRHRLDIYSPEGIEAGSRPSVVFFSGGCWGGCRTWPKENYQFVGDALTAAGYVAVLADYRLHPEVQFPEIMDDAAEAMRWVHANIEVYGGNPRQLFVMGHSAGAHIAAMLAFDDAHLEDAVYREIRGFIGLAGPYDFLPLEEAYQRVLFGPEDRFPLSQPINFVDGSEPAMLLLHGEADDTVKPRNLVKLAAKVKRLNGKVETRRYADVDHGMIVAALAWPLRDRYPVFVDIRTFIDRRAEAPSMTRSVSQRTE